MAEEVELLEVVLAPSGKPVIHVVPWDAWPVKELMDPTPPEVLIPPVEAEVVPLEEEFKSIPAGEAVPMVEPWELTGEE